MEREHVLMNKDILNNIISFLDLEVTKSCYCCNMPLEYSLYIFDTKQRYIKKYNCYKCRFDYVCNEQLCIDFYDIITDMNDRRFIFASLYGFVFLSALLMMYLLGRKN